MNRIVKWVLFVVLLLSVVAGGFALAADPDPETPTKTVLAIKAIGLVLLYAGGRGLGWCDRNGYIPDEVEQLINAHDEQKMEE